jgi:HD superfamily phosphodiesterase
MPLSDKIASSEAKYRNILEEFFVKIYDDSYLPSHGIDHHRRVWKYAKEILVQLESQGFEVSQSLTDQLIISCLLHDSGLSVNQGVSHGIEGRKICERFLMEHSLPFDSFSEALHAIENHDNKEYLIINKPDDLLTILSVADDLDAFGYIGIYRYLEIYITRGKPFKELGHLIIENGETRYRHFLGLYGFESMLVQKYTVKYDTFISFFDSYNQQALYYNFDNQSINGHCGIAEIIAQRINIPDGKSQTNYHYDPVIQHFFYELNSELSDLGHKNNS